MWSFIFLSCADQKLWNCSCSGLSRCGKSCRLRWTNYLRPDIKRGRFSPEEEQTIIHLHALLGNRWSAIASHLPRRTDNEIKNYWNTHLKKRLLRMGIDPVTHQASSALTLQAQQQHYHHSLLHLQGVHHPRSSVIDSSEWNQLAPPTSSNYLTHMSQWDCVRAEAEARLASTTNLHLLSSNSVSTITTDLYASPSWTPTFEDVKGLLLPVPSRIGVDGATADSGASTHPVDGRDHVEEHMSTSIPSCSINPVDLQKFLQDWDSSLQPPSPNLQTCLTQSHVSTDDHTGRQESSPCSSLTRHSSSSFQSVGHYCEDMDAAEQIQRSSSEVFQESVDNVFSVDQYNSPISTVCSNSRSPGAGSTIVAASDEPGFMPAAPIIHHEEVHQHHESDDDQTMVPSDMVVSEVTTFWQRQQAAMVEAGLHQCVPDQCNFLPELEPLADRAAMEFGILPNHLSSQIPHFESWCRGLHTDQNKLLTFESIGLGRTIL